MKNIIGLATAGVLLLAPVASTGEPAKGSLEYLDYRNGFLDVKFGSGPASVSGECESSVRIGKIWGKSDGLDFCDGNIDRIGNASVRPVSYGFYKDRLARVGFRAKADKSISDLLDVFRSNYGEPTEPASNLNPFGEKKEYNWVGKVVRVSFVDEGDGYALVTIESRAELARMAADKANTNTDL